MQDSDHIIKKLQKQGHRFTKARKLILDFLIKNSEPLSFSDIQTLFLRSKISVNKTTVYRELDFLKKEKAIRELQFGDSAKRYEIMPDNHHHHIMCIKCEKIEHVELERDLDEQEKIIAKKKKFKVLGHSLEFFGLCADCQ